MNNPKNVLDEIIHNFSVEKFTRFFREKSQKFLPRQETFTYFDDENFTRGVKIGEINFSETESILICAFEVTKPLSEQAGKKAQYEKAKSILKTTVNQRFSGGIFIFYDDTGNFRFSLVYPESIGVKRQWNNFRRFTYFVSAEFTNKTFLKQIGDKDFNNTEDVKEAFSITAVTDLFYKEFFDLFKKIVEETKSVNKISNDEQARDFILLFTIRTIFLGFIQRKKWLGNKEKFIQNFYREYKDKYFGKNEFYKRWLTPLFFEALNSAPGRKVAYGDNEFSKETEARLQMFPFLNGGLFRKKQGYDDNNWLISDLSIEKFFNFLFSHSFTIEENSLEDEDLQLNPEFLGIIFERLVNKADGAVYTPRPEVDLMCRLSLVKWLEKNLENEIRSENIYELFFRESEKDEDQKQGSFSQKEAQEILEKLENLAICDPAVGSGAFLVGMMQVLDEVEQSLKKKYKLNGKNIFERKKQIIKSSLYGVEVKEWAVWICQLRLWLSLFVDAPDELKTSLEPILPSLDFKVRQGDSLIQRVGSKTFPISGHILIQSNSIKRSITKLKKLKQDFFENKIRLIDKNYDLPRHRELAIYEEILEEEIKEKNNEINKLKNNKPISNPSLFENDVKTQQSELDFDTDRIEKIQAEINGLQNQKKSLRNGGKPLVWNIEFADIFAEKGGFDIVIGNPPYVRQEDISDPTKKIKDKKEYKNCLQDMVKLDFPKSFPPKTKINAQSDLYTYFYIRSLRLLNPGGIHTFICSNSWLDVGYGVWLQNFLLNRCPVELIIDNQAKRSFQAADVNTIISIISAPQSKVDSNHITRFVAFKKPFESAVFTENLIAIEKAKEVVSNDVFRVYPISNKKLRESGTEEQEGKTIDMGKYIGDKWGGKYLRAPDIFFIILEKGKDKLVKLGDIAEVKFGIKTGANDFFYLTEQRARQWKIEPEFLKPIIKSPRESKSIIIEPKDLKFKLFVCNKNMEELKGTNALKYIEWGEKQKLIIKQGGQKGKTIVGYNNVSSVGGRKYWYGLGERQMCLFVVPSSFSDSFKIFKNTSVLADKRMYEGYSDDKSVVVLLNSVLFPLFMELGSRVGLGEGLLDVTVEEVQKIKIIDPTLTPVSGNLLPKRGIKSVFEEYGINPKSNISIEKQNPEPLPDRAELDNIVFDALELSKEERKDVYRAVCRLVWNRINKAHSI